MAGAITAVTAGCLGRADDAAAGVGERISMDEALGFWRIQQVGSAEFCLVGLKREANRLGFDLHVERCNVAALSGLSAWRFENGRVVLLAQDGHALLTLEAEGANLFTNAQARYRMTPEPIV